jgi:hypothetical protein
VATSAERSSPTRKRTTVSEVTDLVPLHERLKPDSERNGDSYSDVATTRAAASRW